VKAYVANSTAPSVLRALLAAGTPVFSTNLYQSRPKLFRPLIPSSARGSDGGPRRSEQPDPAKDRIDLEYRPVGDRIVSASGIDHALPLDSR